MVVSPAFANLEGVRRSHWTPAVLSPGHGHLPLHSVSVLALKELDPQH